MKPGLLFFILAVTTTLILTCDLIAQTNKPASIILPPPDWDPTTHVIAKLVATNKPGIYPLPFAFAGVEKVTARSGWYAEAFEKRNQTNQWFEFDQFKFSSSSVSQRRGMERVISKRGMDFPQAAYRPSLHSDTELLRMTNVLSVSNLFGWNPFSSITNPLGGGISGRYFTLRPYDSIEMLQVTFLKRGQDTNIDSILIKRSRLQLQQK